MPIPENDFTVGYAAWKKENADQVNDYLDKALNQAWLAGAKFGIQALQDAWEVERHE